MDWTIVEQCSRNKPEFNSTKSCAWGLIQVLGTGDHIRATLGENVPSILSPTMAEVYTIEGQHGTGYL